MLWQNLKLHNQLLPQPQTRPLKLSKSPKKVVFAGVSQSSHGITSTTNHEVTYTCLSCSPTSTSFVTSHNLEYNLDTMHERHCFVWREGWTSWIYILHFFGFTHITVIKHEYPVFIDMLRSYYTFSVWSVKRLSLWLESHLDANPLCILEGTGAQVTAWMD